MNSRARHFNDAALIVLALLISAHAALSAATLGDYPNDAGPALAALLHGDLHAFANATPAMGDVSLLVRAPFAAIAYLGHPTPLQVLQADVGYVGLTNDSQGVALPAVPGPHYWVTGNGGITWVEKSWN